MTATHRTPVETRGRRVPGLYRRTIRDGAGTREVFEYRSRVNGQYIGRKLEARTKRDALAEYEKLRVELRSGFLPETDRRLTIGQLAAQYREAFDSDPSYSPRTLEDKRSRLTNYVVKKLGTTRVVDCDARLVRKWAKELPEMRAKTHANIVSDFSTMFMWALAEGLVEENPVARARERFRKDLHRQDAERFRARTLTDAELGTALKKVGPTYRLLISFVAETGARVSEALAVRFEDIDAKAGTWTIAGQLHDGDVRRTKTAASMVTLPLSDAALAIVKEQRKQAMRQGFSTASPEAFVFTGRKGQVLTRRNALRAWQVATKETLGHSIRLHDLRHSLASRLTERNVPAPVAQGLLRHARLSTTVNIYTQIRGNADERIRQLREAINA